MKNLTTLKGILICFFLAGTFSYSFAGIEIPGAISGNWQNPMTGLTIDLGNPAYVILDSLDNLNIHLEVYTTDNDLGLYDDLFVIYNVGGVSDTIRVDSADLIEIERDVYKATYVLAFNFSSECVDLEGHPMSLDVMYGLVTYQVHSGTYEEYPFEDNTGLFNPVVIPNLIATHNHVKTLVCDDYDPGSGSYAIQDNQNTTSNNRIDDSEVDFDLTSPGTENSLFNNQTTKSTVYPNPFISEVNLTYQLITSGKVEIHIIDMNGIPFIKRKCGWQKAGIQQQFFNFSNPIISGNYLIVIYHPKKVETIQLIKL